MIEQMRVAEHEAPSPDFYLGRAVRIGWAVLGGEICHVVKARAAYGDWFPEVWLKCERLPAGIWGPFSARMMELIDTPDASSVSGASLG